MKDLSTSRDGDAERVATSPAMIAAEPDGAPRIAVLDILRGIAILGILFMNINDMGGSLYASFDDIRHFGWTTQDQIAWWLREVIANGTARCMLEMLFGAGMVILTDRAAELAGTRVVMKRYYARNLLLFAFGVVHILVLLWPGDILHTYGLAALIAFLFRGLRPRLLLTIGLSAAALQFAGGTYGYVSTTQTQAQVAAIQSAQRAGRPVTAADRTLLTKVAEGLQNAPRARPRMPRGSPPRTRRGRAISRPGRRISGVSSPICRAAGSSWCSCGKRRA
ncbi:hypothetical protein [Sphingomonas aerolata]|uniref:DUF418 domain-containing protein n=1 Tax=Sphingomonas aerolata TaxID=185951 RepID=UPI002FE28008